MGRLNFFNLPLQKKVICLLLVFGIAPAFLIFLVYQIQKVSLKDQLSDSLHIWAKTTTELIERNFFERYGDVQAFTQNAAVWRSENWRSTDPNNELNAAISRYMTGYGLYDGMLVLDTKGIVQAVNVVDSKGNKLETGFMIGRDLSKTPWFQDAISGRFLKGRNGLDGTAVGKPQRVEWLDQAYGRKNTFVVPFSAQIKNATGELVGIWINFANMNIVEGIFQDVYKNLEANRLPSSELTLVDSSGLVLAEYEPKTAGNTDYVRDFGVINSLNLADAKIEAVLAAIQKQSGFIMNYDEHKKINLVSGYYYSQGAYDYPGLGWSVLIRNPPTELYATLLKLNNYMIGGIILSIGLIIFFGYSIGRRIAAPFRKLSDVMRVMSHGDILVEIPYKGNPDETGMMAKSIQEFGGYISKAQELSQQQLESAVKQQKEVKAALLEMSDSLEKEMQNVMSNVIKNADIVVESSENLSKTTSLVLTKTAIAKTATRHTEQNVSGLTSVCQQLNTSIHEIGNQVEQATNISQNAVHLADRTNGTIEKLSHHTDEIGNVVRMISDIAKQTNLLALNATIEATHAGEAGRGFAVVAAEVKELATQTTKATESVTAQIRDIQAVTAQAVHDINNIAQTIGEIDKISISIAQAVRHQGVAAEEISKATGDVSGNTTEVGKSVEEVNKEFGKTQELSSQLKNQMHGIVRELKGMQQRMLVVLRESTGGDRRENARYKDSNQLKIQFAIGKQGFEGKLVNISCSGAAFTTKDKIPELHPGAQIHLSIEGFREAIPALCSGLTEEGVIRVKYQLNESTKKDFDMFEKTMLSRATISKSKTDETVNMSS